MKIDSIRFKISILYMSILGVFLVFFSIYPIYTIRNILHERIERGLFLKAEQISNYINVYTITSEKDPYAAALLYHLFRGEIVHDRKFMTQLWEKETAPLGLENNFYRIRNLKGRVILRSKNLTADAERNFNTLFARSGNTTHFSYMKINGVAFYGINYPVAFSNFNLLNLQLAMPIPYTQSILNNMIFSCMGGIAIILFLGIFVSRYLTRQVLQPVEDVTRTAKDITQKNLNLRIPVKEYDKEIKELVESFNHMIGRLGNSFAYINDFNSSISHEMKTPLAIIKGELELALDAGNTKEENERIMKDVLEEIYKLIKIIKDLLLLAEYEYKLEIFKMGKIDLIQFLKEIFKHSKVLAAEKNINLELLTQNKPLWIKGDATHLRRVFFNLIHNAVKFTPAGGDIKILTKVSGPHVFISIKDTGIGIALEDQARIFEKFYRIRPVEKEAIEGNGLGLSMARAIARAHKGDITFESDVNKGSTFKVSLPILPN